MGSGHVWKTYPRTKTCVKIGRCVAVFKQDRRTTLKPVSPRINAGFHRGQVMQMNFHPQVLPDPGLKAELNRAQWHRGPTN